MAIVRRGPRRCPLYGVRRRPLLGGSNVLGIIGSSNGGSGTVRSRGGVRTREGPLSEVSLYTTSECTNNHHSSAHINSTDICFFKC